MPKCLFMLTSFFNRFLIDSNPKLGSQIMKNRAPAAGRARFFKNSRFATGIDFWSILVPTCLHFPSRNPPKSLQKSILKRIEFCIDFRSVWEANLEPCWPHFRSKWGGPVACSPLFGWVYVIFRFGGPPGPLLAPFGLDFGRFGARIWRLLVPCFSLFFKVLESILGNSVFQ